MPITTAFVRSTSAFYLTDLPAVTIPNDPTTHLSACSWLLLWGIWPAAAGREGIEREALRDAGQTSAR